MGKEIISKKAIIIGIVLLFVGASIIPLVCSEESWWNENWNYRKKITIDHTKVISQLQNFPVLIDSTSSDYITHVQQDGDDFVFTTNAGVKLNHEIESYDSTSGKLVGWVNVTSLSSTEDTIIWLYYGNPNCSNQQNTIGTWDSNYEGVWHLKESAGIRYDSTSNQKDCLASGTTHTKSAIIDGGEIFDANADGIYTNSNINEMTTFTLECWFAFDTTGANTGDVILTIAENRPAVFRYTDNKLHVWTGYYEEIITSEHTFDDTDWHYLTLVATGSEMRLYVDSILEGSDFWSGTSNYERFYLGNNRLDTDTFRGTIDEARISDKARDGSWIQTAYNSVNSPETFVSIGAEETVTPNQPPVADAGGPYYSPVDTSITFDGSGSIDTDGMIDGYRWDFTNDGTYDTGWLTLPTTTHSYSSAGTYTVKLEVKDNDGDFDTNTTTAMITLEGGAVPTAEANGPYIGFVNHPVSFSSAGSVGGSEGFITSWYWTFGDGLVSSQQNPTHIYTSSGTFTVTLKVTNNYGQSDTDTTTATISDISPDQSPPVADAGGPYLGVVGIPITFNGSGSTDADGTIVSYVWNFGDSTTGTGVTPTHTYTIPGNYTVVLTVTDNDSLTHSNSTIATINVSGPPTIVISVDLSNIEPIEEENEKTFAVTVQCEHQPVRNIHLEILEQSNLTIMSLPSNISLNPGESREIFVTLKAPKLTVNDSQVTMGDETIILRAVGDGNITSNTEQVNFKVIKTDETPGFETLATLAAVGSAGALVTFFRRRHRNR